MDIRSLKLLPNRPVQKLMLDWTATYNLDIHKIIIKKNTAMCLPE
jgi:hypothetical protein